MEARLDRAADDGSSDSAAASLPPAGRASPPAAAGSTAEEDPAQVTEKTNPSDRSGGGSSEGASDGRGGSTAENDSHREGTPVGQHADDSPKSSGALSTSGGESGGVVSPLVVRRGPGRPRKDGSSPVQRKKLHSFPGRPRVRSRKPSLLSLAGSSGRTPPGGSLLESSYEMELEHPTQPPLMPQASASALDSAHSYDQPGLAESPLEKQDELSQEGPERVCALCNLGDGSAMGQGKLVRFDPTLGFQPFRKASKMLQQRGPSLASPEERFAVQQGSAALPVRRGGKGLRLSRGKPLSRLTAEFKLTSSAEETLAVGFAEEPEVGALFEQDGHTYVHRNCAAWSEGVCPGEDDTLIHVDKAVFSGMSQICSGCQKYGASIRCHLPDCGMIFHFPCASAYGCFQDMKALILLCPSHADKAVSYVGSQASCQSCEEMVSKPDLLFCTVCGAHYHGFCLDPPVVVTPSSRLGWQCPDCKTCQSCRQAGDEARLLTCDACDKAFHVYCVKPMVANVPKHGWKCQNCRVCGDCGSRTPGSGPSSRWHMNFTVCDSCYQQRNKGVACPLCGKAYRQFSQRGDMAQCNMCRKFIHVECDSQITSAPKDGDYTCPVCSNTRQQASLLQSSKADGSVRLRTPTSDGSPDYIFSPQKDIASCGNDDSRSSNDNDVLQQTPSGGMQSPETEAKFPPPSHHSLGKPPFARFPGKRRFSVGRTRATGGKFAAKRRAKAAELRRKRGPKPKLKSYYPSWNVSQGTTAATPEAKEMKQEDEPARDNKMVIFSASDEFVLSQDLCAMCGSFGRDEEGRLLACFQCGQCYHPYCANVKLTKMILKKGWRCLDCTVCEGCGQPHDESRLLLCDECDTSYHTYCLSPPLETVPQGNWKCRWCVVCLQCGTTDPGFGSQWQNNYTQCGPCASQTSCPLCLLKYQENDLVIQCVQCERWMHGICDQISSEEDAERCAEYGYNCPYCRPKDELPPHLLMDYAGIHSVSLSRPEQCEKNFKITLQSSTGQQI